MGKRWARSRLQASLAPGAVHPIAELGYRLNEHKASRLWRLRTGLARPGRLSRRACQRSQYHPNSRQFPRDSSEGGLYRCRGDITPMAMAMDMRGRERPNRRRRLAAQLRPSATRLPSRAPAHGCRGPCASPCVGIAASRPLRLVLTAHWKLGSGRLNVGKVEVTADDLTMKNPSTSASPRTAAATRCAPSRRWWSSTSRRRSSCSTSTATWCSPTRSSPSSRRKHGLLDNAKGELELFDGVEIDASNGLKARLSRATVYSKEHRVVSKQPVDVMMPTGRVQGSALTLRTDTREATFVGDVDARLSQPRAAGRAGVRARFASAGRRDFRATHTSTIPTRSAMFTGEVVAVQGESKLKTPELHVSYEGKAAAELRPATLRRNPRTAHDCRGWWQERSIVTAGSGPAHRQRARSISTPRPTRRCSPAACSSTSRRMSCRAAALLRAQGRQEQAGCPGGERSAQGRITATLYQGDQGGAPRQAKAAAAESAGSGARGCSARSRPIPTRRWMWRRTRSTWTTPPSRRCFAATSKPSRAISSYAPSR